MRGGSPRALRSRPSLLLALSLLALLAAATVVAGMALPLLRSLYEQSWFLWVSIASTVLATIGLIVLPFRAETPLRRRLPNMTAAAVCAGAQAIHLYHEHGSPSLLSPTPEALTYFRELVHVAEYGFLAWAATRILRFRIGGALLYLTSLAYAVVVGVADETVQWLHALRVGDLRDVILNGVSAAAGLGYAAALAPTPRATTPGGRRLALALLGLAPVLSVEFYIRTQTGHVVCDDVRNCFTSHFTASELREQGVIRLARWKSVPFGSLADQEPRFWAREDFFLTEARAHFRLANDAAAAGDWRSSCGEVEILLGTFGPAIHPMGARPQDYSCSQRVTDFRSRAFAHLDTTDHASGLRTLAVIWAALAMGTGGLLSRRHGSASRAHGPGH